MRLAMPAKWSRNRPPRTVYVGSHEHKLSSLAAMRIDPDDDGHTREDVKLRKTERHPPNITRGFL